MHKKGPIIIVEDEVEDQELLKGLFEELHIENPLHFFQTAPFALDYLSASPEKPFLILSDIFLPSMSGFDFLKAVREHPKLTLKCIPFLFFTAVNSKNLIERAYRLNAQGFFVKPLTSEQLKRSMNAIINYWRISAVPC